MSQDKQGGDALPDVKWYKNVMAVLGLGTAMAGAIAGILAFVQKQRDAWPWRARSQHNIELLVERSTQMAAPFGGATKWEAAVQAVQSTLDTGTDKTTNLALRQYGGVCPPEALAGETSSQLLVPFQRGSRRALLEALQHVAVGGQPTLFSALAAAAGDLERFRGEGVQRTIVVVTAGGDACYAGGPEDTVRLLKDRKIEARLKFIAFDPQPKDAANLARLGDVIPVTTIEAAKEALHRVLVIDPVNEDARSITDTLNGIVGDLNDAASAMNAGDVPKADAHRKKARDRLRMTDAPFRDLVARQTSDRFRKVYEGASALRALQSDLIDRSSELAGGSAEDRSRRIGEYNQLIGKYNEKVAELNRLQLELLSPPTR